MRTQSHQITIESNRERSQRDHNMVATPTNITQLPKPPAAGGVGHHRSQHSVGQAPRRDNSVGMRRGSSKHAGEIVIED